MFATLAPRHSVRVAVAFPELQQYLRDIVFCCSINMLCKLQASYRYFLSRQRAHSAEKGTRSAMHSYSKDVHSATCDVALGQANKHKSGPVTYTVDPVELSRSRFCASKLPNEIDPSVRVHDFLSQA